MKTNPMTACDFYKLGHQTMDIPGVQRVVSTWTPRSHKYTPDCPYTVNFGYQWIVQKCFVEFFKDFFKGNFEDYAEDFRMKVGATFNPTYIEPVINGFAKLHNLGYLPIEVWAVPEGYLIEDGCPAAMIFNTVDGFGWLPQFLEDLWSMNSWLPSTSATTAYYRRRNAESFYDNIAEDETAIRRLCGDFSMRGMTGHEAAAISGAGHLLSFDRTATIDANSILAEYYGADLINNPPGYGTPSLEHSVVEKGVAYFKHKIENNEIIQSSIYAKYVDIGLKEKWDINLIAEMCFMIYMLTEVQPNGVFTYVSDTYDFWGIIGNVLPTIKDIILNRNGKLVIRPDSGNPVKVILGNDAAENHWENLGVLKSLAAIFGNTTNKWGYKMLEPHIGFIYGDAITAERQKDILTGAFAMMFSPENITLGIGAYTYQYVTRDTRGFAIKATDCTIDGIGEISIFKEPKTDTSKRSQRGAVVVKAAMGNVVCSWIDGYTLEEALNSKHQIMRPIFRDGDIMNTETIYEIRNRLWNNKF